MKKRNKHYIHQYPHYKFDRNMANAWNDEQYRYWLICDEGRLKPPPQRETNFFFKYCKINHKTGKSVLSYIPKDYAVLIERWVRMTTSERKKLLELVPDACRKINHWLHQAEDMYWNDIVKAM